MTSKLSISVFSNHLFISEFSITIILQFNSAVFRERKNCLRSFPLQETMNQNTNSSLDTSKNS